MDTDLQGNQELPCWFQALGGVCLKTPAHSPEATQATELTEGCGDGGACCAEARETQEPIRARPLRSRRTREGDVSLGASDPSLGNGDVNTNWARSLTGVPRHSQGTRTTAWRPQAPSNVTSTFPSPSRWNPLSFPGH